MITIEKQVLLDPLSRVVNVTTGKYSPILDCVFFGADKNVLTLTGSNSTVSLSTKIPCECDSWSGCVPAQKLLAAVKSAPSGNIAIKPDQGTVTVLAGRSKMRVPFLPSSDYPLIEYPDSAKISIKSDELLSIINSVCNAMPKNDAHKMLNGVFFEAKDGKLITVATDGLRLAYGEMSSELEYNAIVPAGSVNFLKDLLSISDSIELQISSRMLIAYVENYIFTTQLIDSRYPDWRRVNPKRDNCLIVNSINMISALERASIIGHVVRLNIKIDCIELLVDATQSKNEKLEDVIDCKSNAEIEIGCNAPHMIDAIRAVDSEDVEILFSDSRSPFIIKAIGKEHPYTIVGQVA